MQRSAAHRIALPDAERWFAPHWLAPALADALLSELRDGIAWETHRIRLFGRLVDSPRLSCWIGDPDAAYTYLRTRFEPRIWPAPMLALRARLEQELGEPFNGALMNLYGDGRDSMGCTSYM